jgi:antitoxin VapB
MALYIKDREVDALAAEVQAATGAATKTEAVRKALQNELDRVRAAVPLIERVRRIQELAREKLGPPNPDLDFRKFREELWGDED